jgi:hypothetical protein
MNLLVVEILHALHAVHFQKITVLNQNAVYIFGAFVHVAHKLIPLIPRR